MADEIMSSIFRDDLDLDQMYIGQLMQCNASN